MENSVNFRQKLTFGQKVEHAVTRWLGEILPEYTVKNTNQERGSSERDEYSLVDVVVLKDKTPILGVECKRSDTPFMKCEDFNGWKAEENTPLNRSSLNHYKDAQFPFYVININEWCKSALVADIPTINESDHDKGIKKPSGEIIYNFNCTTWKHYKDDFTIKLILNDIIRKEGLC